MLGVDVVPAFRICSFRGIRAQQTIECGAVKKVKQGKDRVRRKARNAEANTKTNVRQGRLQDGTFGRVEWTSELRPQS